MPGTTISEYPVEYLDALDEVLTGATYAGRYGVDAVEFVDNRTVKVPDISFGESTEVADYDKFKTANDLKLEYTAYKLDHDKQAVFDIDAVDDIDTAAILSTQAASQYIRTIFGPYVDRDFFATAIDKAKTKATETLTVENIKGEIRKARSQFTQAGLSGGDLYMRSSALALLEDATDRQWSNETTVIDTVGNYDGFQVFEVPDDRMKAEFVVISGGIQTIRYITKRAVSYLFAPGTHTSGDCWLSQHRWVYGNIVYKNKVPGLYANASSAVNVISAKVAVDVSKKG